jgi:hypothetical protein
MDDDHDQDRITINATMLLNTNTNILGVVGKDVRRPDR